MRGATSVVANRLASRRILCAVRVALGEVKAVRERQHFKNLNTPITMKDGGSAKKRRFGATSLAHENDAHAWAAKKMCAESGMEERDDFVDERDPEPDADSVLNDNKWKLTGISMQARLGQCVDLERLLRDMAAADVGKDADVATYELDDGPRYLSYFHRQTGCRCQVHPDGRLAVISAPTLHKLHSTMSAVYHKVQLYIKEGNARRQQLLAKRGPLSLSLSLPTRRSRDEGANVVLDDDVEPDSALTVTYLLF